MMNRVCEKCGKKLNEEGILFCPYCGAKLEGTIRETPTENREAAEWIRKAMKVTSLPERKKILEQAKKACPEDPEIDWELLFIGTPDPKPPRGVMDYSIIKCWLLQIYRTPEVFPGEKRDAMRQELFEGEQLRKVLAASGHPEETMRAYLERLCREYIDIFLKEDNRLMGNLFGLRIGRNRTKILEEAGAGMVRQIEADGQLAPERKQMLSEAMLQAMKQLIR